MVLCGGNREVTEVVGRGDVLQEQRETRYLRVLDGGATDLPKAQIELVAGRHQRPEPYAHLGAASCQCADGAARLRRDEYFARPQVLIRNAALAVSIRPSPIVATPTGWLE